MLFRIRSGLGSLIFSRVPLGFSMTGTPGNELLTGADACRYLGITQRMLYRYLRDQRIPAFKLGTEWRFIRSDLEQWVQPPTKTSVNAPME